MEINGINLEGLAHEAGRITLPEAVRGRTVHIDADFLAYQVSYEHPDRPEKNITEMQHNAEQAVSTIRALAAATAVHLHLTPSDSNKGGRAKLAILKEYQSNRVGKEKPRLLHVMREWLAGRYPATLHMDAEADDGMASAQYIAIADGKEHLSIIATKDKDLNMVPGLHLDWDTGAIHTAETFGELKLRERGSGQKVLDGYGQKFFWGQMLTGDPADTISGLPKIVGSVLNEFKPLKDTPHLLRIVADPTLGPSGTGLKAKAKLDARPAGLCGPVMAVDLLNGKDSNRDCFMFVKELYKLYGEQFGYKHWATGEDVPWNKVFIAEAQLLWMRAKPTDPNDVIRWFKEIV